MGRHDKPLTPAEQAELAELQRQVRDAIAKDPEGARDAFREAVRDMRDFPSKSGDLKD